MQIIIISPPPPKTPQTNNENRDLIYEIGNVMTAVYHSLGLLPKSPNLANIRSWNTTQMVIFWRFVISGDGFFNWNGNSLENEEADIFHHK